jgi:type IV pilus assembly protein PilM
MWNKTITLYIDDTSVRLMVNRGQRIKKWADLKLDPGMVKGGVVVQEADVANRIRQLLKSQKIKSKQVILGFSGLHSLTRPITLPPLPRNMVAEAVAREARRVLPVPLDQLYLSWRALPFTKSKIHVFLAATPRKTADSLVRTMRQAGLDIRYMVFKPLVLTKALAENTAIVVDVQPTEFDVVVMSEGIAQPIRTVTFPDTELTWDQKLHMIIGDLDRTIKFFDSNNADKPLASTVPVYVSGELLGKSESTQKMVEAVGHPVLPLSANMKGSDQMDSGFYMVNMAMALKNAAPIREGTFPVANMNVLPAPYHPKPISLLKVVGAPGGAAIVALIVPMVMMMQNTSANITAMQTQMKTINQQVVQKTAQKTELKKNIADLQKKSAAAKSTYENLKVSLDTLGVRQETVNGDMAEVLYAQPPTVILTSISENEQSLILTGTAVTEGDVLTYGRNLDLSGRFTETTVTSMEKEYSNDPEVQPVLNFTLTMNRGGGKK